MKDEMHILCSSSRSEKAGKVLVVVGEPMHGVRFDMHRPDIFTVVYVGEEFKLDYEKIKWLHSDLSMIAARNVRSKDIINLLFEKIKLKVE